MKTYHGFRDATGTAHVTIDDGAGGYRPLVHLVRHSPTGYEWNYGGSGPADLARSLLADVFGLPVHAALYQRFKFKTVASLPHDEWLLDESEIRAAAEDILRELGVTCPRCFDRGICEDVEAVRRSGPTPIDGRLVYCTCPVGRQFVEEETALVGEEDA